MASNFPDTTQINEETGVVWVAGDIWIDSESGVSYIFEPIADIPSWRTQYKSIYNDDERYVEAAGDDMTGDLKLLDGPNTKITLSTSGKIATTGEIQSGGDAQLNVSGTKINSSLTEACGDNDQNDVYRVKDTDGNYNLAIKTNGDVRIGGTTVGLLNSLSPNIYFSASDGNITTEGSFTSTVTTGSNLILNKGSGAFITLNATDANGSPSTGIGNSSSDIFQLYGLGDSARLVLDVVGEGSAVGSFGDILIGNDISGSGAKVTIGASTGSAEFKSNITTDGYIRLFDPDGSGNINYTELKTNNDDLLISMHKDATLYIDNGEGGDTVVINADGSAKFADQVFIGPDGKNITLIPGDGGVGAQLGVHGSNVTNKSDIAFSVTDTTAGNKELAFINWDGSAEFTNNVTAAAPALDKPAFVARPAGNFVGRAVDVGMYGASKGIWDTTGGIRLGPDLDNSPAVVVIDGTQGSAQFAGPVSIGGMDDQHTMSEYEEGIWTPTCDHAPLTIKNNKYTRVGRLVTLTVDVTIGVTTTTDDSVFFEIKGLPYAVPTYGWTCGSMYMQYLNAGTENAMVTPFVLHETQSVFFKITHLTGLMAKDINMSMIPNSGYMNFNLTYHI